MIFNFISPNGLSQNNMVDISGKSGMGVVKANNNLEGLIKFSEKLSKLLDNSNSEVKGSFESAANCKKTCRQEPESAFDKLMGSLAKEIKNAKGNDFINKLKLYLALSGNKSDGISLNEQSMKDLEKLLIKAGFDKSKIDDLMKQLQLKSSDGKVNLADLFKSLSKLKSGYSNFKEKDIEEEDNKKDKKEDKKQDDILLAISSLPFLESIMTSLGIPENLSGKILSDAKKEGQGINLDTLIDGLQKLGKQSFISGINFKIDSDNKNFTGILAQIGFPKIQADTANGVTGKDQFTLNDFITGLEQMRKDNRGNKGTLKDVLATEKAENRILIPSNKDTLQDVLAGLEQIGKDNGSNKDILNSEFDTEHKAKGNEDDLLNTFMAGLAKGNNANKNFMINNAKAKKKALALSKSPGFLKESFFPLQTGQKLNENQLIFNKTDSDPELAKLLDEDDLLNTFMASLAKGNNANKNFMVNNDKFKKKALALLKSQGFLKESFFPLQTGQKLNENQLIFNKTNSDPELAKLLDNLASLAKADRIDHTPLDSSKKNQEILFDKADKASLIKIPDFENASGGTFRESGMTSRNFTSAGSRLSSGTLPSYVTNQVVRSFVRAVYRGDNEMRLQLKPPELGRLIMKIDNLGDSLKVSIITENHAAKDIIASHENSLKAALAGSGISIETFDVSMGSNFSQSMADTGNNSGTGFGSGNKSQSESTMELSDEIINNEKNKYNFFDDGALHFVA